MSQKGSKNKVLSSEDIKSGDGEPSVSQNGKEHEEKNVNKQIPTENNMGNEALDTQNNNLQENYNYEQNKKEIMEKIEIRKQQADMVEKYINETGIGQTFQIIFSELISKKIPVESYYTYTASRLREIGREKEAIERKNNKNNK